MLDREKCLSGGLEETEAPFRIPITQRHRSICLWFSRGNSSTLSVASFTFPSLSNDMIKYDHSTGSGSVARSDSNPDWMSRLVQRTAAAESPFLRADKARPNMGSGIR